MIPALNACIDYPEGKKTHRIHNITRVSFDSRPLFYRTPQIPTLKARKLCPTENLRDFLRDVYIYVS